MFGTVYFVRKKADLNVAFQSSGDKVSGPFAEIEFKGHPRAAVLLNGSIDLHVLGFGFIPIVVNTYLVVAGGQVDGLTSVADGLAIHKHVGLLRLDMNLQSSCFLGRLCKCRDHVPKAQG
jgi:hypothetical protein